MANHTYFVQGMHCASCELLIEKELLTFPSVKFVDASLAHNQVNIKYGGQRPNVAELNKIFLKSGYSFSETPFPRENTGSIKPMLWAFLIIIIFILIAKLGLLSSIRINASSSLGAFYVFGLLAGISSCAALIGGLVLSLSKQWLELYDSSAGLLNKMTPHILFNVGRVAAYALFGAILGALGEKISISPLITTIIMVAISIMMVILAMQMLGIKEFNRFRIALPKAWANKIYSKEKTGGRYYPLLVGMLTILLPCGFTLIAEGAAILSGSLGRGLLIMLFFALGTMLPLMLIGLSSVKLSSNRHSSEIFLKTAGLLIIFFVIYNLNVQFGLSRYITNLAKAITVPTVNNSVINNSSNNQTNDNLQPSENQQVIKAVYSNNKGLTPNSFNVVVGQSVRLEIEVRDNVYGCMSTILIPRLWDTPELMRKGKTIVMEFTPSSSGTFPLTCAMGVPWGEIIVNDN